MKVSFLGVQGGIQSKESSNTSLVLENEDTVVLVDVSGSPVQLLLQLGIRPQILTAVILTHAHIDHLYALPSLLHNLWLMQRSEPLTIIGNQETLATANRLCEVFGIHNKKNMFPLLFETAQEKMAIRDLHLTFFSCDHKVPTLGFVMENRGKILVYSSDTRPIPFPLCATNCDLLIHEASGSSNDRNLFQGGHSNALDAAKAALGLNAKTLCLCHLPANEEKKEEILKEAKSLFPKTKLASPLENITL